MCALDRVIGYESIKKELYRVIDSLKSPQKYEDLGVNAVSGILFSGEPGIGKTFMAQALIEDIGWSVLPLKKNCPKDEFIIHTVKLFNNAEDQAIIFMDDIDKYGENRDSEIYATIQSCIDDSKCKRILIIATANDLRSLPGSLYRVGRFDKVFDMKFPVGHDAEDIFKYYLSKVKTAGDIDAEEIARCLEGYSCAALEHLVYEAATRAGYSAKAKIDQEDIRSACLRLFFGAPETLEDVTEIEKRKIAVHEAGHALVAEILQPGCVNFVSIEASNSNTLGITSIKKTRKSGEPERFCDKENSVLIDLAGKAATEVVLGEIDTGANGDICDAFTKVIDLHDYYTSYDFHSWCHGGETSQKVYDNLDIATQNDLMRYYFQVKSILINNRDKLDKLISAILVKKTLFFREIQGLCR